MARVVALAVLVAFAATAFVLVRWAGEQAALAVAAERLAAGDPAAAERQLALRAGARARAGRALSRALSGAGREAEGCACAPEDLAYFRPRLLVEEAIRRGDPTGAVRVARLARETGDPAAGVALAAALVEAGSDGEARAALSSVPAWDRDKGLGREVARVLDLRGAGAACIVRDRGRRLAGTLDASGSFHVVPGAEAYVPPAAAEALAGAARAPGLRLAVDFELSRLARDALGGYRGSVLAAVSDAKTAAEGGTPAFEQRREPASIAKIVTAAAALRAGIDPDAEIARMTCEGFARYGGGALWCAFPGGKLSGLGHALAISCNVAFANLGMKVGPAALVEEFRRWGFDGGREAGRILQAPEGGLPLAKMAVGLDATDITPLHAARLAAVAAAGEMPEPALVAATDGALGLSPRTLPRPPARTVLDPPAAALLRRSMEAVTRPGGTAEGVAPAAFPVAMKTGTASTPGQGYHVNYVGVGPLPHLTIAFCVRVTGQPTSAHVTRAAREVLSNLLQGLAGKSFAGGPSFAD